MLVELSLSLIRVEILLILLIRQVSLLSLMKQHFKKQRISSLNLLLKIVVQHLLLEKLLLIQMYLDSRREETMLLSRVRLML